MYSIDKIGSRLGRILATGLGVLALAALAALVLQASAPPRQTVQAAQVPPTTAAGELEIDKIGPETVMVSKTLAYSLLITNNTGLRLEGVIITDTWTEQIYSGTYSVQGNLSVISTVLVTEPVPYMQFHLAALPPGASGSIGMSMIVPQELEPNYLGNPQYGCNPICFVDNSAVIKTSPPNLFTYYDTANTMIVGPVLRLTKTYTPISPRAGRLLTYTFAIDNLERADSLPAHNVVITEKLPDQTLFYAAYPAGIATYDPDKRVVQWRLPQVVPVGDVAYVTLTVRVDPTRGYGSLYNRQENCGASADGVPKTILCDADVKTEAVDDVFEKTTETISPPAQNGSISQTFPNRLITYTIYVHNPYTETITDLHIIDTFPNASASPAETFQYVRLLAWGPPGPPTLALTTTKTTEWIMPSIAGWGLYTFSFLARIPPNMPINKNSDYRDYNNQVGGKYGNVTLPTNSGGHDDPMKVREVPQILTLKSVKPGSQYAGEAVTYTLTLSNSGPTTVTNIVITDVLPDNSASDYSWWCYFEWGGMVSGTPPSQLGGDWAFLGIYNAATWQGITLTGYASWTVIFTATVNGWPEGTQCKNSVRGYSPDTYIVEREWQLAPVTVLLHPGLYANKTVEPRSVVLSDTIRYNVQLYNASDVDHTIYGFTDTLPLGFFYRQSPIFTHSVGVARIVPAGSTSLPGYEVNFPVSVSYTPEPCDNLPKDIPQKRGVLRWRVISPWVGIMSAPRQDIAPVKVYPHAQAIKTANPPGALPGGPITFTIVLSNNSALTLTHIRMTDTLPGGFSYGGVLSDTPRPVDVIGQQIIWDEQTIPKRGLTRFVFTATAPIVEKYTTYSNIVKAASTRDPLICIPQSKLNDIAVAPGLIEIKKTTNPTPLTVDPLGRFAYDITLKNIGPYSITLARFTDTLPGFVTDPYPWKFISMQSGDPAVASQSPPAWKNLTIERQRELRLRFTTRVGVLHAQYPNLLGSDPPPMAAGQLTASLPISWALTTTEKFDGAPVTVLTGVGLDKDVNPTLAFAGSTVDYTIFLFNQSGVTINSVFVTDTLPTGFGFEKMISGRAPRSTQPLAWSLGSLANQSGMELVFRARIGRNVTPGDYPNRRLDASSSTKIPSKDDIAPVTVIDQPGLALDQAVTPSAIRAGQEVSYTITLNNPKAAPLTVRLTDTLPAEFSFVSMSQGPQPSLTSPLPVWEDVVIPPNGAVTLVFRARASASAEGTYFNQVEAAAEWGIPLASTGPGVPVEVTGLPGLTLSKTVYPSSIIAGREVTYTLEVVNLNTEQAITARLTDTLPAGFTFIAMVEGATPVQSLPQVVWENITVSPLTRYNLIFRARAEMGVASGSYTNQLDGSSAQGKRFAGTGPSAAVEVAGLHLSLSKSVTPTSVNPGQEVTYTLTLSNTTQQALTIRLTDTLPVKFSFVRMADGEPAPALTTPQVVWEGLTIPANATRRLHFCAVVAIDAVYTTYRNQLSASSGSAVFPGSGPSAPVNVLPGLDLLDLRVAKSDGVARSVPGDTLVYEISYCNVSPDGRTANQVVLTETFQPASYLSAQAPGWRLVSPGVYTRLLGTLAPGAASTVPFTLSLASTIPATYQTITNQVRIGSSTSNVNDPPTNNTATDVNRITTTTPVYTSDLAVTDLSYTPAQLRQGEPITIVVHLKNQGQAATTGPDGSGWFSTDVYIKPGGSSAPSGAGDRYLGLCPTATSYCPQTARWELYRAVREPGGDGLGSGESWVLTYTYILSDSGSHNLYVQADTFWGQNGDPDPTMYGSSQHGRISEDDEQNNIYGPVSIAVTPGTPPPPPVKRIYLPIVLRQSRR